MRNRFTGMDRSKLCVAVLLMVFLSACAVGKSESDEELFMTRSVRPQPSPELTRALELDVAPWHKPGVVQVAVKLPEEAVKRHQEAALAALEALPPTAAQDDFDRAWIALEKARVLRDLGRDTEAATAYEKLLIIPHSAAQSWYARSGLLSIRDKQNVVICSKGVFERDVRLKPLQPTPFVQQIVERGIEGWVQLLVEAAPDGAISNVIVEHSSKRAFEKWAVDETLTNLFVTKRGEPLGQKCFIRTKFPIKVRPVERVKIFADDIEPEQNFSYHSIGAAIRVRIAARAEVLANQAAEKASEAKASQ